ncbi:hypothetical protein Lal_00048498 [Lupinus albus]|nr:hypothetical protein Lal_00048498 [Lupinus albus]
MARKENLDFLCIQETKLEFIDYHLCSTLWYGSDFDWIFQPSIGRSGGLLCIWKTDKFQKSSFKSGKGYLGVTSKYEDSTELCHIVNVYSSCNYTEKRQVWLDLGQWKNESPSNLWCFAGDFNSVKCSEERKGRESHGRKKEMFDFSCFINNLELLDLPLADKWPNLVQNGLIRMVSDHCAVVLSDLNQDWGPKPFCVLNAWFKHKDFSAFVEQTWSTLHFSGWSMFTLKEKLKKLKSTLKTWNMEHFGAINTKIDLATQGIHQLDLKDEVVDLTDAENLQRSNLWADLWQARSM